MILTFKGLNQTPLHRAVSVVLKNRTITKNVYLNSPVTLINTDNSSLMSEIITLTMDDILNDAYVSLVTGHSILFHASGDMRLFFTEFAQKIKERIMNESEDEFKDNIHFDFWMLDEETQMNTVFHFCF